MADNRKRKTKAPLAGEEAGVPSWRQPLRTRRKKVRPPSQPVSPGARLAGIGDAVRGTGRGLIRGIRAVGDAFVRAWHWLWAHWRTVLLLPALVAASYGCVQVATNEHFFVYTADIQGNERVATDEIYQASGVDGLHVLWLRPGKIAGDVEKLPWVAEARVNIAPPNRISITVQERQPLVAWRTISQTVWFAADGTRLPIAGAEPPLVLSDDAGQAASGAGLRSGLLQDLDMLHSQRPALTTVYFGLQEGLYYRAPEGWEVYLGSDGQVTSKLALLDAVRPQIAAGSARPKIVDLRVVGDAYLR